MDLYQSKVVIAMHMCQTEEFTSWLPCGLIRVKLMSLQRVHIT